MNKLTNAVLRASVKGGDDDGFENRPLRSDIDLVPDPDDWGTIFEFMRKTVELGFSPEGVKQLVQTVLDSRVEQLKIHRIKLEEDVSTQQSVENTVSTSSRTSRRAQRREEHLRACEALADVDGLCYLKMIKVPMRKAVRENIGPRPGLDKFLSINADAIDMALLDKLYVERNDCEFHITDQVTENTLLSMLRRTLYLLPGKGNSMRALVGVDSREGEIFSYRSIIGAARSERVVIPGVREGFSYQGKPVEPITPATGPIRTTLAQMTHELVRLDVTNGPAAIASCRAVMQRGSLSVCGEKSFTPVNGVVSLQNVSFVGRHLLFVPPDANYSITDSLVTNAGSRGVWLFVDGCVPVVVRNCTGPLVVMRAWPDTTSHLLWQDLHDITEMCKTHLVHDKDPNPLYFVRNDIGPETQMRVGKVGWNGWKGSDGYRAYVRRYASAAMIETVLRA